MRYHANVLALRNTRAQARIYDTDARTYTQTHVCTTHTQNNMKKKEIYVLLVKTSAFGVRYVNKGVDGRQTNTDRQDKWDWNTNKKQYVSIIAGGGGEVLKYCRFV